MAKNKCLLNPKDVDPAIATACAIKLLESPFWPAGLEIDKTYSRTHDDCDGKQNEKIFVETHEYGEVLVYTYAHQAPAMRFRMPIFGGGRSPRTRNALLLLALAMKLDSEEKPDKEE
jgi:hypothetical protein